MANTIFHSLLPIIFVGYLIVAVWVTATYTYAVFIRKWEPSSAQYFERTLLEAHSKGSLTASLRWRFDSVLFAGISGAAWPAVTALLILIRIGSRRSGVDLTRSNASLTLAIILSDTNPVLIWAALLQVILCCVIVRFIHTQYWCEAGLVLIALTAVMLRHLKYALREVGLPAVLRSRPGNPQIRFTMVLICDFLVLALGLSALSSLWGKGLLSWQMIYDMGRKIILFKRLWSTVTQGGLKNLEHNVRLMTLIDILTLVSAALFYFVLARSVIQLKEFKRTDEDHATVALCLSTFGQYKDAIDQLSNVHIPTSITQLSRMVAYLGLGQVKNAFSVSKRNLVALSDRDPAPEDVFVDMTDVAVTVWLPASALKQLLRFSIEAGVADSLLVMEFSALLMLTQLTAVDLFDVFPEELGSRRPLVFAYLLIMRQKIAEAVQILKIMKPERPEDQLTRLHLIFLTLAVISRHQSSDQMPGNLSDEDIEWGNSECGEEFENYLSLCKEMREPWSLFLALEKLRILNMLLGRYCDDGSSVNPREKVQMAIDDIEGQLKNQPGGPMKIKLLSQRLAPQFFSAYS